MASIKKVKVGTTTYDIIPTQVTDDTGTYTASVPTLTENSTLALTSDIPIGITEISSQYIRITDLDAGIYKLTYNGTKYIYYYGATSTTTHTVTGGAGEVILTINKYSTTYWHWWYINGGTSYATLYYGYTSSSSGSYNSKSINSIYTGTPTDTKPQFLYHYTTDTKNTSGYTIYRYQILMFNGTGYSAFTSTSNSTSTNKTQLALKYYPNTPIFYYNSTSSVSSDITITGTSLYSFFYNIDLRYSFNITASTLTPYSPVYIKMSVDTHGELSPVYSATSGGHPLVQSLPYTEDGYVYVYLGQTTSTAYYLDLELTHPCFWYKNGKILPYGTDIDVDVELSPTSTNPVQNKAIYDATYIEDESEEATGFSNNWSPKTWSGLTSFYGSSIWTDGENIYYSSYDGQYVLDKSTSTWNTKTWYGLTSFSGSDIWTDGTNIYYSGYYGQYVLDKATSTWNTKTWTGLTNIASGQGIWTDGDNIYYTSGSSQYVLDKSTSTWSTKTWYGTGAEYASSNTIWTDGTNVYCSNDGDQFILDKSTSTWSPKTWSGLTNFYGAYVWTDGENIYCSDQYTPAQYVLDKATSTWSPMTWSGLTTPGGNSIWTDGENIYYSSGSEQYVLDKEFPLIPLKDYVKDLVEDVTTKIEDATTVKIEPTTWNAKTWSGLTSLGGSRVWTDGTNIYYSLDGDQYVLNKSTSTWNTKIWSGLTSFDGEHIWTDGTNIYYSNDSDQYVLNKTTSTWSVKTWYGLTNFYGSSIWTDGENIYLSSYSDQYVLNKSTSTWSTKTWYGYSEINGVEVWTDGTNIYCTEMGVSYVLDKATSTWSEKTWPRANILMGDFIWTDGENTYYSMSPNHYVLDKSTSTWSAKTWSGFTDFYGLSIWTDGENVYYSEGTNQYVLDKQDPTPVVEYVKNLPTEAGTKLYLHEITFSTSQGDAYIINTNPNSLANMDVLDVYTQANLLKSIRMCIGAQGNSYCPVYQIDSSGTLYILKKGAFVSRTLTSDTITQDTITAL